MLPGTPCVVSTDTAFSKVPSIPIAGVYHRPVDADRFMYFFLDVQGGTRGRVETRGNSGLWHLDGSHYRPGSITVFRWWDLLDLRRIFVRPDYTVKPVITMTDRHLQDTKERVKVLLNTYKRYFESTRYIRHNHIWMPSDGSQK